ncbi:sigma factor [Kitasatospora phosalacinea]|uniref:sigma factor n=1 Tax=Kitasatospora phosalacinea TaxID=2065 RepID=UPI00364BA474
MTTPDGSGAFHHQHVDAVLGFVARRVGDPHLAADLTADVFAAALEAAAGYRPERGTPLGGEHGGNAAYAVTEESDGTFLEAPYNAVVIDPGRVPTVPVPSGTGAAAPAS